MSSCSSSIVASAALSGCELSSSGASPPQVAKPVDPTSAARPSRSRRARYRRMLPPLSGREPAAALRERALLGTHAGDDRRELLHVEAVDAGRVPAEHRGDLVLREPAEGPDHLLPRVGPGALGVRVVAAPHDVADADRVAE